MDRLFTIFTPTYNRKHTLPKLYNSLVSQSLQCFEWLIVDDGSTDGTEELIKRYITENKIPIRYYQQSNSGKHIAINIGVEQARGEWFWIVDSDDYLRDEALCNAKYIISQLPDGFTGFSGIHFSDKVNFDSNQFGKRMWTRGGYEWPHPGEMAIIFKTEVFRQFPFPVFEGEKFCQESLIFRRINLAGNPVMNTDYVLVGGDYMEDGLSQNLWNRLKANPRYSMLNFEERIKQGQGTRKENFFCAKCFWDIAINANGGGFLKNVNRIPYNLTFAVFFNKILKKIFR